MQKILIVENVLNKNLLFFFILQDFYIFFCFTIIMSFDTNCVNFLTLNFFLKRGHANTKEYLS